jgi:uncharacterized protein (TIGR02646 family)
MIKIEKDLSTVPLPLQFPTNHRSSETVQNARKKVVEAGIYPRNKSTINKYYKSEPIKSALFTIYHGKCAFCEQRVERFQVEHFRPKSSYFWLAFSWDNLLYACPDCNGYKSDSFDLFQNKATIPSNFNEINTISQTYDAIEEPKLVNPERENVEHLLLFQRDGLIFSENIRVKYTISICKIDRDYLNDYRKKILDDFEKEIQSEMAENQTKIELKLAIDTLIRRFIRKSTVSNNEFIAFRRFASKNLLDDILKENMIV